MRGGDFGRTRRIDGRAAKRAHARPKLAAKVGDIEMYDTWGGYRADCDELSRLQAFTGQQS